MFRKKRRYRSRKRLKLRKDSIRSVFSVLLFLGAIFTLFSFFGQAADLGSVAQDKLDLLFGWGAFMVPFLLANLGLIFYDYRRNRLATWPFFLGLVLLFVSLISLFHFFIDPKTAQTEAMLGQGGGVVGHYIQLIIRQSVSSALTFVVLVVGILVSVLVLLNTSLDVLMGRLTSVLKMVFSFLNRRFFRHVGEKIGVWRETRRNKEAYVTDAAATYSIGSSDEQTAPLEDEATKSIEVIAHEFGPPAAESGRAVGIESRVETVTNLPHPERVWEYPPITLLADGKKAKLNQEHLNSNAKIIEETLESFGVRAKVVEVNLGPAITQYALELTHGTKISKVTNLQHDLALALAAPTGMVRIEAPIPGKSLVGIEVPNSGLKVVNLKSMLTSAAMQKAKSVLKIALGEDVSGRPVVADIAKMPHVLVAGSTGSGKSVLLNSIIATILFRASPSEVKLILVDQKRVELSQFRGIPHLLAEVVVETEQIISTLTWAVDEMDRRYRLFEKVGARNIVGYNETVGFQALPNIVIVIDELGDIIMTSPRKVESNICRIAQLARATGIHLIIATQRPSVDVLTGLIKANVPSRIAFNVSSMVDSRVIIDMPGAEKLLGKGDMLYVPPDSSKPTRIQGVFVSDKEINALIGFLKSSGFEPDYKKEITEYVAAEVRGANGSDDEMFADAVKMVCEGGVASISLLQRKLHIGYNRAANLMDELEDRGVVSPPDGAKKRNVLITDPQQVLGGEKKDGVEQSWGNTSEGSPEETAHL